jgi:hypothetical protein
MCRRFITLSPTVHTVLSILGSHRIEVPELDLWVVRLEVGLLTPETE